MCRIFYLYLSTLIMKNFKNVPNLCSKVVWDSVCCSAGECQGCAWLGSVSRSANRYVNKHERKRKQPVSLQRREFFFPFLIGFTLVTICCLLFFIGRHISALNTYVLEHIILFKMNFPGMTLCFFLSLNGIDSLAYLKMKHTLY